MESLFNIHETLASILRKLSYDIKPTYRRTPEYLERVCDLKNHIIVVDEANDLSVTFLTMNGQNSKINECKINML